MQECSGMKNLAARKRVSVTAILTVLALAVVTLMAAATVRALERGDLAKVETQIRAD